MKAGPCRSVLEQPEQSSFITKGREVGEIRKLEREKKSHNGLQ